MNIGIYTKSLLHIGVVVLAALQATIDKGPLDTASVVQLIILFVGSVVVYWAPNLGTKAANYLKVIGAAVIAVLTVAAPFIVAGHITTSQIITVIFAAIGALTVGIVPNAPTTMKAVV
jgi:hypothetical protein